jgi:2',3'-cyclic-nucleotide 2'-phosphodiesterase (5'-nucleotidase family)
VIRLFAIILLTGVCSGSPAAVPRLQAGDIVQVSSELTTRNARTEESNLGNIVADAVRAAGSTDAAFVAAAALSEHTIAKGSASPEDFLKALEFRTDTVVVLKLTGIKIKEALEHAVSLLPQKNSAFLQVSGLSFEVNLTAERGKRVSNARIGGAAVADMRVYTVAMPSPLANGALAYLKFWDKQDIDKDTGRTLEQALTSYVKMTKSIPGRLEDRIVIRK